MNWKNALAWTVEIRETAEKQILHLDMQDKVRIVRFLRLRLSGTHDPRSMGKPLRGRLAGLWRYRVGNYRLLCRLRDETITVIVLEVGHRREVYRTDI
ncbi:MAG: type II toxin-antitoxin system RelE/ParE family toxin [Magnetococcales bacterium]|nr:type II toxin-antitoxin system RelE/ParE family toxin [Magnetococcales bacterium]MBF0322978.1 type II toxin-antitoxin system RelE/ParE family toxin [Magnetococcales bacterium]